MYLLIIFAPRQSLLAYPLLLLQVQSVVDVSKPAYGQLQKLKGKSLDEVDTPEKKNPEPKANRLLLLELTDGVIDLQAMEYQPLAQLNPAQLLPGTKVNLIVFLPLIESNVSDWKKKFISPSIK